MELNNKSFPNYVKTKAYKFLKESAESLGDPNDLKMNTMVDEEKIDSTAKVEVKKNGSFKEKSAEITKDDTTKVDMLKMDKEAGKDAALVSVEDKKEEFKSEQPSKEASTPFKEDGKDEMNSMDKEGSDETKAFVKAGADMKSKQSTNVGMKKPEFKVEAENEKDKAPIADAIQIPEGLTFKGKNELLEYCRKEAKRIAGIL